MRFLKLAQQIIAASVFFFVFAPLGQTSQSGPRAIGAGAFPVSFTLASAWFADRSDANQKDVTLLVYFEGSAGWEDEPTDFKWEVNKSPATIQMSVGKVQILVRYWSDSGELEIQGAKYKLSSGNVFLVEGIDGPKPTIRDLGMQDLAFTPNENPAIAILKRNPDVWAALSKRPSSEHARSRSSTVPAEVVAWDKEGLRLLLTGKPEEEKKGCELFRQAATQGYAGSQYRLGYCYESGRGMAQNFSTANDWYEKAAKQDFVDAQYKLGHSYRVGRGTSIDLATALEWYKRAAKNGDNEAMYNVGWMYATGQGTGVNAQEAYFWFLEGARHGETNSQMEVARRLRDADGVAKDLPGSCGWLLVLKAQQKSFAPADWLKIEETTKSVESQLDRPGVEKAEEQAHDSLELIANNVLQSYAR
jgi:Sel1 repeat-containing protein